MSKNGNKTAQTKGETNVKGVEPKDYNAKADNPLTGHRIIVSAVQSQIVIDDRKARADEILDEARGERKSVANELLMAAKSFTHGNVFKKEAFLNWCSLEETYIKSDDAGKWKVSKVPACWSQAKSNIKRAFERGGLLPTAADSVEKLTEMYLSKVNSETVQNAAKSSSDTPQSALADIPEQEPEFTQLLNAMASMYMAGDDKLKDRMLADTRKYIKDLKAVNAALAGDVEAPADGIQTETLETESKTGTNA